MNIVEARKILKNKIIGITCHNSIKLARNALISGANYIAISSFIWDNPNLKPEKAIEKFK